MQGLRSDKDDIVTLLALLNDNILIKVLSGGVELYGSADSRKVAQKMIKILVPQR